MNKRIVYGIGGVVIAALAWYYISRGTVAKVNYITTNPSTEIFKQSIHASGELKAKKSLKIRAPDGMNAAGIWQTSIKDLIPEGTTVKKGDYIGSLERTELANQMQTVTSEIEKEQTRLDQTMIDTAISIKEIRDQIADIEFNIQTERLEMEKNIYESQMVLDQSKLTLEKSERNLRQLRSKMELIRIQNDAKVLEVATNLKQLNTKLNTMSTLSAQFSIMAPEDGMLIYASSWEGKKGPGSQVSAWNSVVAELPDLSKMITIAYVNEVDISQITKGQLVKIKLDAFPEKSFSGQITNVANIGQELRNQDAKVFEVTIEVNEFDEVMRPAMSTTNEIIIYEYNEVLSIPLDAYYSDSISYVYKRVDGNIVMQEVLPGPYNQDHIIIAAGLDVNDEILLTKPESKYIETQYLNLTLRDQAIERIRNWQEAKKAYDLQNLQKIKPDDGPANMDFGGSNMIIIGG